MKNIVLFDLDNTIRNMDHRLHYLKRDNIDWREFEEQCEYDLPISSTILLMRALKTAGKQVWIWTGCSDHVRTMTTIWLHRHQVPFDQLLMKPVAEEETPALTLKLRWLKDAPVPEDRVICAFDDDPSVIKGLRKAGLTTYQVIRPIEED